jgi:phage repressor protein C with HTH and peptisase S24 domain
MSLGTIIRARRRELGYTQDQAAERAGISKPYLSNIETGKAKNPPTDRVLESLEGALAFETGQLTRLAHLARTPADVREERQQLQQQLQKLTHALRRMMKDDGDTENADLAALLEEVPSGVGDRLNLGGSVPVINNVAAGYPQDFTDLDYPAGVADEYVQCPDVSDAQAFGARVVGDSMEPRYREGDIVVFSPNSAPNNGSDCFVRFEGGGTTFKRMYQDDPSRIRLQPLNPDYPARTYATDEVLSVWPAVLRIEKLTA